MKVSLLNERITIGKSKIEVDKKGNHKMCGVNTILAMRLSVVKVQRKKQVVVLYGMKARLIFPLATVGR